MIFATTNFTSIGLIPKFTKSFFEEAYKALGKPITMEFINELTGIDFGQVTQYEGNKSDLGDLVILTSSSISDASVINVRYSLFSCELFHTFCDILVIPKMFFDLSYQELGIPYNTYLKTLDEFFTDDEENLLTYICQTTMTKPFFDKMSKTLSKLVVSGINPFDVFTIHPLNGTEWCACLKDEVNSLFDLAPENDLANGLLNGEVVDAEYGKMCKKFDNFYINMSPEVAPNTFQYIIENLEMSEKHTKRARLIETYGFNQ